MDYEHSLPRMLQAEFKDVLPTARRTRTPGRAVMFFVIGSALLRRPHTHTGKGKGSSSECCAASVATSCNLLRLTPVEQSFAHLHFIEKAKRSDASEQANLDAVTLRLDMPAALRGPLVLEAQLI